MGSLNLLEPGPGASAKSKVLYYQHAHADVTYMSYALGSSMAPIGSTQTILANGLPCTCTLSIRTTT